MWQEATHITNELKINHAFALLYLRITFCKRRFASVYEGLCWLVILRANGFPNETFLTNTTNYCLSLLSQDNTIVAFFSQRSGSVETFGSNDYISYEIECSDIADSGVDRTVSNLLGAT